MSKGLLYPQRQRRRMLASPQQQSLLQLGSHSAGVAAPAPCGSGMASLTPHFCKSHLSFSLMSNHTVASPQSGNLGSSSMCNHVMVLTTHACVHHPHPCSCPGLSCCVCLEGFYVLDTSSDLVMASQHKQHTAADRLFSDTLLPLVHVQALCVTGYPCSS
jgi:hypothetical protein